MKGRMIVGVLCMMAIVALPALAQQTQAKTPRADKREVLQKKRIKKGVKSGELTKPEARRLVREQKKIRRDEKAAKADGKVTPRERAKLQREQNKASRDIARKKHNQRTRKNKKNK